MQFYIFLVSLMLSVMGCAVAQMLPKHESVVQWIAEIHNKGCADISWTGPMLLVSLFTVTAGASVGPEGVMIVVGGNVSGYAHIID